jgi:hypothetical protein
MIIFTKQPDGTWAKTGDQLPTETHMQILVDADSKPLNGVYSYPEAIKMVEDTIAKGAGDHYRYEITSASAKALSRAGIRKQARAHADKTIKRILDTPEQPAKPKAKATPKPKAAKKAPKAKAATREEKRAAIIKTERFQKAYAKAKEKTDRKECAHGHKITPENTHFGDLFRTGLITCDPCNVKAQARHNKKAGK